MGYNRHYPQILHCVVVDMTYVVMASCAMVAVCFGVTPMVCFYMWCLFTAVFKEMISSLTESRRCILVRFSLVVVILSRRTHFYGGLSMNGKRLLIV